MIGGRGTQIIITANRGEGRVSAFKVYKGHSGSWLRVFARQTEGNKEQEFPWRPDNALRCVESSVFASSDPW